MLKTWITNKTAQPFYARKEFSVDKKVKSAQARVCGLGQFEFHMNGRKVSDHELDPGWTDYNKWIQYVTFDVKDYVKEGKNVLGAEVGNGWYIKMDEHYTFAFPPFMPPNPNPYKPFGKYLILSLELELQYEDGTAEIIQPDETFKVKQHPVVMSNVYGSETIDGRLAKEGWDTPEFDASEWEQASVVPADELPKGVLKEQFQPAVKVLKTYEAKYLHEKNGREIYDFGQNMSGLLELEIKGNPGDTVKIYPAEKLGPDGDVDQVAKNWVTVDSCNTFIVGKTDQWEHFRMKFTYFAGRFVGVERTGQDGKAAPEIRGLKADAVSSAWKTDGHFTCDDKRYEQIYDIVEKAVEANMVSGVHTDCPTIERFAWQEPNHLMAPAIMYMKDGRLLWEKFLTDMRYGQHTKEDWFNDLAGGKFYPGEGLMPSQCPCYIPNVLPVPGMGSFYDIIAWGSTCILGTWWHYQFYGDKTIIVENFEAGLKYFAHLETMVTEDGFISHGLGDWGNPRNELARENVETAFFYADAVTLARFAEILNKPEKKAEMEEKAEKIRENYNNKLMVYNEAEGFWCYRCQDHPDELFMTQASQALPLFWGMVPEEKIQDVTKALRYTLDRDDAFICGEVGLPYVIQAARRAGMNDLISRFILKKEHPSYYAFVLDGETTLGEYWETNPRSHCHDMMGHIVEWYYNGIAGIQPEEPGFKKVTIRPYLPETIHEFTCSYQSASGLIRVHVKEEDHEILAEIECADGIEKHVDLSNLVTSGKHVIMKDW